MQNPKMEIITVPKKRPYLPRGSPPGGSMQAPVKRHLPESAAPRSSSGSLIANGIVASVTESEVRHAQANNAQRAQSNSRPSSVLGHEAANATQAYKPKTKIYYSEAISKQAVHENPRSLNSTGVNNGMAHSSGVAVTSGQRVATTVQDSSSSGAAVAQNGSPNRRRKQDLSNLRPCNSMSVEVTNGQSQAGRSGLSSDLARTSSATIALTTASFASHSNVPKPNKQARTSSSIRTISGQGDIRAANTARPIIGSLVSSSALASSGANPNKAQMIDPFVEIHQKVPSPDVVGSKRSAESHLPRANGPRPLKQAKAVASTSSGQAERTLITIRTVGFVGLQPNKFTAHPSSSSLSSQLAGTSSSSSRRQPKQSANTTVSPSTRTNGARSSQTIHNGATRPAHVPEVNVAPQLAAPPANAQQKYCWHCHLEGAELQCSRCHLSWHKIYCADNVFKTGKAKTMIMIPHRSKGPCDDYKKLQNWIEPLDSVRDPSVCIECARKDAGRQFSERVGMMEGVNGNYSHLKRVSQAFGYAINSLLMKTGKDAHVKAFAPLIEIEYGDYGVQIDNQIDLTAMHDKIEQNVTAYLCVEDFMFDINMICHSFLVLTQKMGNSRLTDVYQSHKNLCKDLVKSATNEMLELDRCDSCYRNHYEVNWSKLVSAMVMPCEYGHSLVWMKHNNLWWPAKVTEYRESKYFFKSKKWVWVTPFGDSDACKWTVFKNKLHKYSIVKPDTSDERRGQKHLAERDIAIQLANEYIAYWNMYYNTSYNLPEISTEFTINDLYTVNHGLKKGKENLDEFFVLSNRDAEEHEDEVEQAHVNPSGVRRNASSSRAEEAAAEIGDDPGEGSSTGRTKRGNARHHSSKQRN